jgi:hypothetical protein
MAIAEIVAALDEEIARLHQVKALLLAVGGAVSSRGTTSFHYGANLSKPDRKRKPMSSAARAKISAAQKKRWAKQKKEAASK